MTKHVVFPFAGVAQGARRPIARAVPRISPAAVRVPDPRQLEVGVSFPAGHPQIFVHEGARQALERRFEIAHHRPVVLSVTDNRRHVISFSSKGGVLRARIHHMFLDAPPRVQDALVAYVVRGDRESSQVVGRYIDDNGWRLRATRRVPGRLVTQGKRHDLYAIFQKLNETYFDGAVDALVTWGRAGKKRGKSRRSIKLGSYSAVERLIRVHPSLDRKWVPRYFVAYVVYHEMLHHLIPSAPGASSARSGAGGGRRLLHPPMFQAREQLFRDFARALAWEQAHIGRLLRT